MTLFALVSCKDGIEQPPYPEIAVNVKQMDFPFEGGEQTLTLTINRDWEIETKADWLAFDYEDKSVDKFENNERVVNVTALYNTAGNVRTAKVRFRTSPATVYTDVLVVQAKNPTEAPQLLYYNGFGAGATELSSGWPLLTEASFLNAAEGEYAGVVKYYNPQGKMSYRQSGPSESSEYPDASGDNHLFFGAIPTGSTAVDFVIGDIPIHKKTTSLIINFAYTHSSFKAKTDNELKSGFDLYLSKDGENWLKADYSTQRYDTPKYLYCECRFSFDAASFEKLFCMFEATEASVYRMDDVKIRFESNTAATAIDWSKATSSRELGEALVIPE